MDMIELLSTLQEYVFNKKGLQYEKAIYVSITWVILSIITLKVAI